MAGEFGPAFERLLEEGAVRQEPLTDGQLEVLTNADLAVWGDAERHRPNETTFYWKCMVMASSLEVWIALLRGQKVPRVELHPDADRFLER